MMNYKRIKAVIFDLDGTLLNTLDDLADSVNYILKKHNYPIRSVSEIRAFVGNGALNLIKRSLPGCITDERIILPLLHEYNEYYGNHCAVKTDLYPGIKVMLTSLSRLGIKMAVVSNKPDRYTKDIVAQYFDDSLFSYVTGNVEGVKHKPDPTAVFNAMDKLHVNADECIYIGDSGVDMQTAENAGIFSIGVLWGFRDKDDLINHNARLIVNTPNEIFDYIKRTADQM